MAMNVNITAFGGPLSEPLVLLEDKRISGFNPLMAMQRAFARLQPETPLDMLDVVVDEEGMDIVLDALVEEQRDMHPVDFEHPYTLVNTFAGVVYLNKGVKLHYKTD